MPMLSNHAVIDPSSDYIRLSACFSKGFPYPCWGTRNNHPVTPEVETGTHDFDATETTSTCRTTLSLRCHVQGLWLGTISDLSRERRIDT